MRVSLWPPARGCLVFRAPSASCRCALPETTTCPGLCLATTGFCLCFVPGKISVR
jgi:hypothetical protein